MYHDEHSADATTAALKASPPWMAVVADKFLGMTLNEWVLLFALIYTILQIVVLVRNQFLRKRSSDGDE